jgi:SAM-dependent methyltransferase
VLHLRLYNLLQHVSAFCPSAYGFGCNGLRSHDPCSHPRLRADPFDNRLVAFAGHETGWQYHRAWGGTGALAESVLAGLPETRLEMWDIDAKMLAVASQRLRRFGDRVTLRERSFTEPLGRCNAVIATLSLHHVSQLDAKRAVYANIFDALIPGGIFPVLQQKTVKPRRLIAALNRKRKKKT